MFVVAVLLYCIIRHKEQKLLKRKNPFQTPTPPHRHTAIIQNWNLWPLNRFVRASYLRPLYTNWQSIALHIFSKSAFAFHHSSKQSSTKALAYRPATMNHSHHTTRFCLCAHTLISGNKCCWFIYFFHFMCVWKMLNKLFYGPTSIVHVSLKDALWFFISQKKKKIQEWCV